MNETQNNITNQLILEEILRNRTELKNTIEASETRLLKQVEELNNKLNNLEKENADLKNKIKILETKNKKNNIVLFGLENSEKISPQFICQQLKRHLDVDVIEADINNLYLSGNSQNGPVVVEFLSYIKKNSVMKNCYKLKGTTISIAHDLNFEERQKNKILRKHLNLARQNKNNVCYIKKNKLYVNGNIYTSDELENKDNIEQKLTVTPHLEKHQNTQHPHSTQNEITSELTLPVFKQQSTSSAGAIKKQLKETPGIKEKIRTRSVK